VCIYVIFTHSNVLIKRGCSVGVYGNGNDHVNKGAQMNGMINDKHILRCDRYRVYDMRHGLVYL
jgi:hypothetical protein